MTNLQASSHSPRDERVHAFVEAVVGGALHAKRVLSLTNGVVGVIHSASLAVAIIGRALGQANGLHPKHAIKQVDRMLSNSGIDLPDVFEKWVPYVMASRPEIIVALDWTDFDKDGQTTFVPLDIPITLLADRGFCDVDFYEYQRAIGVSYVIRFKSNHMVTDAHGVSKRAREWLAADGKAKIMRNVAVTAREAPLDAFVCVRNAKMKEAWFLACSGEIARHTAAQLVKLYGKRFTVEENFRDIKDIRFGVGLSSARIKSPERRDRLLLLSALALGLLTFLGAAVEAIGYDRWLRANTVKTRTHSLFNQGCYYYGAMPNMPTERLLPLVKKFGEMLNEQPAFQQIFGIL